MKKILRGFVLLLVLILFCKSEYSIYAEEVTQNSDSNSQKYYLGSAVNTGKDNGYSNSNAIKSGDVHFGWELGRFYVSGYTSARECGTDCPVFLKNVGDQVTLKFQLKQDINKLNGKTSLTISNDKNGYDNTFGVTKTSFGHGALIIKHTDYQNNTTEPQIYTDFLFANASTSADTTVQLCEEGDYEVTLDYEIDHTSGPFGAIHNYTNYKIYFKFSVRNGNCMVYPFDVVTGAELTNSSMTENGFYIDLAKSRYVDINVKKEVLNDGKDGLIEDTRFNRPAKDGEKYTDEGIYTITAKNNYTNQETTKKIYVGKNNVLKASVSTDLSVAEINKLVSEGAQILDDGSIIPAENTTDEEENEASDKFRSLIDDYKIIIIIAIAVLFIVIVIIIVKQTKKRKTNKHTNGDMNNEKN